MKKLFLRHFGAAAAVFSLAAVVPLSSIGKVATVQVGTGGDVFFPAVTNITTGDSVVWTWTGNFHSTTSGTNGAPGDDNGVPGGLWDSAVNNAPHTFTNTFTSAGTFSYYCSVHFSIGMTGEVVVASALVPPIVVITAPTAGAVFSAPAKVTVQASVTNGSGTVDNVRFLVGNAVITNTASTPFSAVTNLPAGNYTLTAIASDNNNLTATNSVSISVVPPVTVSLASASISSRTNFQFSYSANVGLSYVVQRSTNLVTWSSLATNTAASNPVVFVDLDPTNNPGFYRVGRMPNP